CGPLRRSATFWHGSAMHWCGRGADAGGARRRRRVEGWRGFGFNWGMKGRRAVVAVVFTWLLVALALLLRGSEREPQYQGRALSDWLLRRTWKDFSLSVEQDEAVRSMGTNALPYLVKWMKYVSQAWRVQLVNIAPRVVKRVWFLRRDKQNERAMLSLECLQMLGPRVSPALPELARLMKQTNAVVAVRALMIVDSAGKAGIPVLLDVLTNR